MCARILRKNIVMPKTLTGFLGLVCLKDVGLNGSEWRRGMKAKVNLFGRVREVNANPSAFSEYTREFAKLFAERWDCANEGEWETEWMPC